jgi:hypothetical protein
VAIGNPMALMEPKLTSRMAIAARMPTTVAKPSDAYCACSIA